MESGKNIIEIVTDQSYKVQVWPLNHTLDFLRRSNQHFSGSRRINYVNRVEPFTSNFSQELGKCSNAKLIGFSLSRNRRVITVGVIIIAVCVSKREIFPKCYKFLKKKCSRRKIQNILYFIFFEHCFNNSIIYHSTY